MIENEILGPGQGRTNKAYLVNELRKAGENKCIHQ